MRKLICLLPHWVAHCEFVRVGRELFREVYVLGMRVKVSKYSPRAK